MKTLTSLISVETAIAPSSPVAGIPQVRDTKPAAGSGPRTGQLVRLLLDALDDAKAEDIISIDLRGKTSIADMMLVASGRSTTHVGAIAERVAKACKEAGVGAPRVEGIPHCDWVLVDAHDVIVHVFRPEVRQFYNLEKMWSGDRPAERGKAKS